MSRYLALPVLLLLLSGCVLYDYKTGHLMDTDNKLGMTDLTPVIGTEEICKEVDPLKPCMGLFCKNDTSWDPLGINSGLDLFYNSNLEGGECWFEITNSSRALEVLEDKQISLRPFMFGAGPSFSSADRANLACGRYLQLASKWMLGKGSSPPDKPSSSGRAACWLRHDTLPVYMYYTGSRAISPARTGEIAQALSDAGPVIITTEVDVEGTDANMAAVKSQIVAIKQNCPGCIAVLAVKSGDNATLQKIFSDPTPRLGGKSVYDLVDAVGFGFRANDQPNCSVDQVFYENYRFTRQILKTYQKPTIWLYVGASEGNGPDGSCQFDARAVHNFYQKVFGGSYGLAASGTMGAIFYEYRDRTGPLPCNGVQGCDFGLLLANGSQKHPELNTWSDLCLFFTDRDYRNPVFFSRNGQGASCDYFANPKMLTGAVSIEVNTARGLEYGNVDVIDRKKGYSCGEVCISEGDMPNVGTYDSTGDGFEDSYCNKYPAIEDYSDDRDISFTYFKAMVMRESSFNRFAVSCADKTKSDGSLNTACNSYELSAQQLFDYAGVPAAQRPNPLPSCPAGNKSCAYGLSQCIEYPGKFYQDNHLDLPDAIEACGGYGYNPFDADNSACCGTFKLRYYLDRAAGRINSNWAELSDPACPGSLTAEDKPWAIYYLASLFYNAGEKNEYEVVRFLTQRDDPTKCGGAYDNYIAYLRSKNPYASEVFSIYRDAVGECVSDCPK